MPKTFVFLNDVTAQEALERLEQPSRLVHVHEREGILDDGHVGEDHLHFTDIAPLELHFATGVLLRVEVERALSRDDFALARDVEQRAHHLRVAGVGVQIEHPHSLPSNTATLD